MQTQPHRFAALFTFASALVLTLVSSAAPARAVAPNDDFANRITITGTSTQVTGNNTGATTEQGEPQNSSNTLWWTWTAPQDGIVTMNTIGSTFDNVLAVFQGTAYGSLNYVVYANDNLGTNQTQVSFPVKSGQTFQIQVGGDNSYDYGAITLNLSLATLASGGITNATIFGAPTPFNDNFANRATLTGSTFTAFGFNKSATTEQGEPQNSSNTLWWTWTAPQDGIVTMDTIGSTFDNVLAVFQGTAYGSLNYVIYENDNLGANQTRVSFPVKSGQTFQIQVGGDNGYDYGTIILNLSMNTLASGGITNATVFGAPTPFNDNFANRFTLTGNTLTAIGFNSSATTEQNEPQNSSTTLWWTWTAPQDGVVTLNTIGSTFDNVLAAFQGTAYGGLNYVAYANDNVSTNQSQISFPVKSGQTFQIQVGGDNGYDYGTIILNLSMSTFASIGITNTTVIGAPTPFNDNFSNRAVLTGNNLTAIGFNTSATTEQGEPQGSSNTLWWSWTAPSSGTLTLTTIGSNFNNVLAVYEGSFVTQLTGGISENDNLGTNESGFKFAVTGGTTYQIQVGGNNGYDYGTVILNLSAAVAPPVAAHITLGGLSETYNGSPFAVTVTTSPTGLSTNVTYAGSGTPPTNAGSYPVVATITSAGYSGTADATLVIKKAPAKVVLGGLTATYTGSAQGATVTTTPSGLSTTVTYNGSATVPTAAGTYTVVATVTDPNYTGTATGKLVIAKASASIVLGNLTATYDGTAHSVTATPTPSGLTVDVTYAAKTTAPTAAGSYAVKATIVSPNYEGTAAGTLVIAKASAIVNLTNLTFTYDGKLQPPTVTTTPTGLPVTLAYKLNGKASTPIDAGSYAVTATVDSPNAAGTATDTLTIQPASATVTVASKTTPYTGKAILVTAATVPKGLPVSFTYNGSTAAPSGVGTYSFIGTISNPNYTGSNTGSLTISPIAPLITTKAATAIEAAQATLNFSVVTEDSATTVKFLYGTSKTALSSTSSSTIVPAVAGITQPGITITGLTPSTTYYFQATGTSAGGTKAGAIASFKTLP